MESHSINALSMRGHPKEKINKSIVGRSKSRGRSKSPWNSLKISCWKCGKVGDFKKDRRLKNVERSKG